MAVDSDADRARSAQAFVDRALVGNATNLANLRAMGLADVEVAVVSLGDRTHDASLVTLHLSHMGVSEIIVKAMNEDHGEILSRVGATTVVYPEKEIGLRVGKRLCSSSVLDFFSVATGMAMLEVGAPARTVGKTLRELDLGRKYGLQVLAIKELVPERVVLLPDAGAVIKDSDILVVVGQESDFERLRVE
jgi:trk system potassium uptake protein TrkA